MPILDLGIGVTPNRVEANELYLQAALAGDSRSMMNLGINLIGGDGIEKNEIEGFAWIDAARFLTQDTPDITTKWRIREVIDHYNTELSQTPLDKAKSRTTELLKQVAAGDVR